MSKPAADADRRWCGSSQRYIPTMWDGPTFDPDECPHPERAYSTGTYWDEPFGPNAEVTWYRWIDCMACGKRTHVIEKGVGSLLFDAGYCWPRSRAQKARRQWEKQWQAQAR